MTEQHNLMTETEAVQHHYTRDQLADILRFELRNATEMNKRAAQELDDYPTSDDWMPVRMPVIQDACAALETGTDDELIAAASAIRQAVIAAVHRRLTAAGLMH